jgi:hypothetical protein
MVIDIARSPLARSNCLSRLRGTVRAFDSAASETCSFSGEEPAPLRR